MTTFRETEAVKIVRQYGVSALIIALDEADLRDSEAEAAEEYDAIARDAARMR